MSSVLVLGRGGMGRPIADAMLQLGHRVTTFDSQVSDSDYESDAVVWCGDINNETYTRCLAIVQPDIVISALPYFLNIRAATECVLRSIPYCDLGGCVDVSARINEMASEKGSYVFTDLGLAPGLVNILAAHEHNHATFTVDSINMYCGGIPKDADKWPFGYVQTWSGDGLYNEYKDDCNILKDGEIVTVPAMSGYQLSGDPEWMDLEAFYTSGAASHSLKYFQALGVSNCAYRTIRWAGHVDQIKPLLDTLTKKEFTNLINAACKAEDNKQDIVFCGINMANKGNSTSITSSRSVSIEGCPDGKLSAMQRATALPCAAAAHWILSKVIFDKQYSSGKRPLRYHHVDYIKFSSTLTSLGINLD